MGVSRAIYAAGSAIVAIAFAAPATAQVRQFEIAAQDASRAIPIFGLQSGASVIAPAKSVRGVKTRAVSGSMDVGAALKLLLRDTGLEGEIGADGVITIKKRVRLTRISGDAEESGQIAQVSPASVDASFASPGEISGADGADIVVTATKRAESAQKIPSGLSAVRGETLAEIGAQKLEDYVGYLPSVTFNYSGVPGIGYVGLRGIAPSDDAGGTMAFYIDDTPVNRSSPTGPAATSNLDLSPYDIDRVEVLRGPQGTLYGANSLGGVIRYVLRKPSLQDLQVQAGAEVWAMSKSDRVGWIGRASLSIPVVRDRIAVRASYGHREDPGFIDNVAAGGRTDFNRGDSDTYRIAALIQATDNLSIDLNFLRQENDYGGQARVALNPATRKPLFGRYANRYVLPVFAKQAYSVFSGTLTWDFGGATLTSATGYSESDFDQQSDLTAAFAALPGRTQYFAPSKGTKFVQEVRLASPTGQKVEWLIGAYYTYEKFRQPIVATLLSPTSDTPVAALNPLARLPLRSRYEEISGFGNVTVKLTDTLDIGGGLRVAHTKTRSEAGFGGALFGNPSGLTSFSGRGSDTTTLWSATARYLPSNDLTLYARAATGFRPGAANNAFPDVPRTFAADRTTSYEAGFKARLPALDAYLEGAIFTIDWDRIQLARSFLGVLSYTVNGGKARSRGFEISGNISPVRDLRLSGALSYSDARLRDPGALFPAGTANDPLPLVTPWTASAAAEWTFVRFGAWEGRARSGVRYFDSTSYRFFDPAGAPIPSATLVDASINLSNERYTLGLFARNLTNARRVYIAVPVEQVIGEPRVVGLRLDARF